MAQFVAVYVPGLLNEQTKMFERQLHAFCVDGVGAILGACLGMSPIVAYIESASGIRCGFFDDRTPEWASPSFPRTSLALRSL